MNIVITGQSSLIGSNLAEYFHQMGNNVTLIGRNKQNIIQKNGIKYLNFDWDDPQKFFSIERNIDIFIHSAGLNSKECNLNIKNAFEFNSLKTELLAELCIKNNVKLFVFLSTIHVYSSNPIGLINEEYKPKNKNPYAESKSYAEKLITKKAANVKMKYLILRLSNIVACPISIRTNCWDLLIQNICMQIVKEKRIFLKSNPNTLRDFVSIKQLCKFINFYIEHLETFNSEILNFASGKTITILSLAKNLKKMNQIIFNDNIEIIHDLKIHNEKIAPYTYSIDKVKSLGFNIDTRIKEELKSTLIFCKSNFNF